MTNCQSFSLTPELSNSKELILYYPFPEYRQLILAFKVVVIDTIIGNLELSSIRVLGVVTIIHGAFQDKALRLCFDIHCRTVISMNRVLKWICNVGVASSAKIWLWVTASIQELVFILISMSRSLPIMQIS